MRSTPVWDHGGIACAAALSAQISVRILYSVDLRNRVYKSRTVYTAVPGTVPWYLSSCGGT